MQTTHKIQLKPNNQQIAYFKKACGISRFAYNWGLARWIELYEINKKCNKEERVHITGLSLKKEFNSIKNSDFPFVKEVTKYACQQPFINLDRAFKNYFKKKSGYPNFQKKGRVRDSFYIGGDEVRIERDMIKIPLLGLVKMTEGLRFKGKVNSVTISRTADRWFASIQVKVANDSKRHHLNPQPDLQSIEKLRSRLSFCGI